MLQNAKESGFSSNFSFTFLSKCKGCRETSQAHAYLFTLIHNYAIIYFFWSDNIIVHARTKYTDLNSMI